MTLICPCLSLAGGGGGVLSATLVALCALRWPQGAIFLMRSIQTGQSWGQLRFGGGESWKDLEGIGWRQRGGVGFG